MRIFWLVTVSVLSISQAVANPARDALSAVAKCAEIAGTAERLQCFDAAAVSAKSVLGTAQKPPAPEAESEGGLMSWFGFEPETKPVTKPEDFGINEANIPEEKRPAEISKISGKVVEFAKNALGRSIFILDNGQVWKQIEGDNTDVYQRAADGPMSVSIEKAMFGSFSLRIDGRTGIIKVRRVK